jgi:hypothetical protein
MLKIQGKTPAKTTSQGNKRTEIKSTNAILNSRRQAEKVSTRFSKNTEGSVKRRTIVPPVENDNMAASFDYLVLFEYAGYVRDRTYRLLCRALDSAYRDMHEVHFRDTKNHCPVLPSNLVNPLSFAADCYHGPMVSPTSKATSDIY